MLLRYRQCRVSWAFFFFWFLLYTHLHVPLLRNKGKEEGYLLGC